MAPLTHFISRRTQLSMDGRNASPHQLSTFLPCWFIAISSACVCLAGDNCNDSLLSELRKKSFSQMTSGELHCYRMRGDVCSRRDSVCADPNIIELLKTPISRMRDDEYAIFEDVVRNCECLDPCSLTQCVRVGQKSDDELTPNESDFRDYCKSKCASVMKEYYPTQGERRRKRTVLVWVAIACGFSIVGLIVGLTIMEPRP